MNIFKDKITVKDIGCEKDVKYFTLEGNMWDDILFNDQIKYYKYIYKSIPTYPGLYMLGASDNTLGKIFTKQLVKNLTDMGEPVLHFSDEYTDIDDICSEIHSFIMRTGKSPFVIIDNIDHIMYSVINGRFMDVKENMRYTIHTLTNIQLENDLRIICTCYWGHRESFREEYIDEMLYVASVIWELRASGSRNDKLNDSQRKIMMQKEKDNSCIYLELSYLKNIRHLFESHFFEYNFGEDILIPVDLMGNPI